MITNIIWKKLEGEKMYYNKLIPELSVFDIQQTVDFYQKLGFKMEYERKEDQFVFMSFQDSQIMFEQIHQDGWNTGELNYPLGQGVNFSIAVDNIELFYKEIKEKQIELYREIVKNFYIVKGIPEEQIEFIIQDPNGYLLRFTN